VPVAARRVDDVAGPRRLAALVRVDLAAARHDDEELVAVRVGVLFVPRAGREHGAADDQLVRPGRARVDQELHLHVDPPLVLAQALLERDVPDRRAVRLGHSAPPSRRNTS
jgi:hypothetical protein